MKHQKTFVIALLVSASILQGCPGPDPSPSAKEKATKLLTASAWTVNNVTIDGVADTGFAGLRLTFSTTGFTSTNGNVVWPAVGSWSFTDDTGNQIMRHDGIEVDVLTLTQTSLVLSLQWDKTTIGNGRNRSIEGTHVFTFSH